MLRTRQVLWVAGVSAVLAGAAGTPTQAAPRVIVDGKAVRGAQIYVIGGHAMVPVRGVVQRIQGARVQYAPRHKSILVTRGQQQVRLNLYSGYARVSGQAIPLDVPVVVRDKQAYLPLRFVSEVLGAQVSYQGDGTISIRSGKPGASVASYRGIPAARSNPGRVAIGGIEVITLPTVGEYQSLEQRAEAVTDRLNDAVPGMSVQGRFNAHGLWIGTAGGDPVILGGGVAILRVTPADAEKSGKPQQQLAQEWLAQMRAGLRRVYGRG